MTNRLGRASTSFALSLLPLLMVVGLLTPVIGPAVDHHYADRSPVHSHVFVGEETNSHDHSNALESHDHSDGVDGDGISVATSSSSSAHGPLTLDGATLESSLPGLDDYLIAMTIGEPPAPDEEAISPFDRPPRNPKI